MILPLLGFFKTSNVFKIGMLLYVTVGTLFL